jgi:hypothetical protein
MIEAKNMRLRIPQDSNLGLLFGFHRAGDVTETVACTPGVNDSLIGPCISLKGIPGERA